MPLQANYTTPFRCAACGADQSVYTGDPDDMTALEVDAVECGRCGKVEIIRDQAWIDVKGGVENPHVEKGIPKKR